ncbi:receptor-like kinase TMK4 [Rutidosis leptorrhynchoides]|uniref:receptor-like kinase TMK4 n=1 Tax=Rutidosis leptorrhynchoides TaxID=125765 RepID=UPI003A994A1D
MAKLNATLSPPLSTWKTTNYCSWNGVLCDITNRVIAISIPFYSISGTLPPDLNQLSQLNRLYLPGNSFSGPIPSLPNLTLLQQINISRNNFSSISPDFFQQLPNLEQFDISYNPYLAPWKLPVEINPHNYLTSFRATNANLIGTLLGFPESFLILLSIQLSHNNLTGSLPNSLGNSLLQILYLNSNKLSGKIDVLSSMIGISQIWLNGNEFMGTIPDVSKCVNLFDLQLRDNLFTGLVPPSLKSVSNISLQNNMLQGPKPTYNNEGVNNNYCLPDPGPCDPQVTALLEVAGDLGYPAQLASSWKGNDACQNWKFITCNVDGNVSSIVFSKQQFSGTISPAFANLTYLRNLYLNDNTLTGEIPEILTALPHLQVIDVSNNNLTGFISRFPPNVKFMHEGNPLLGLNSVTFKDPPSSVAHSNRKKKLLLATVLSVGALIALIVVIVYFKGKLRSRKKTKIQVYVEEFLNNHKFISPKRYSYSDVKKMTNMFKQKLGQGGFGSVYKGSLSNGNLVAVKVLSESKGNGEDFINEVVSIGSTSHVNVVSLVGFCCEGHQRALIYEFMSNGSLEKFIYDQDSTSFRQLGWEKLHQIAIGIARGLEYLHSGCNTRILHFDIKPNNILLDQDFCPKISDFGLAKIFPQKRSVITMSHMRGTPGYIAPEVFSRNFGGVSHKSDVYSYGMMILEIVGGRKNIEVGVDDTSEIYFPHWIYKRVESHEHQLGLHVIVNDEENETARKMIIVGLWCIQINPSSRPTISKVLEMLENDVVLLEIPPKPYWYSPSRSVSSSSAM